MQVFLGKKINKFHNLVFNQLIKYFTNTILFRLSVFKVPYKKCTGEYCVHNVKRNVVVYIHECTHGERGRMDST